MKIKESQFKKIETASFGLRENTSHNSQSYVLKDKVYNSRAKENSKY